MRRKTTGGLSRQTRGERPNKLAAGRAQAGSYDPVRQRLRSGLGLLACLLALGCHSQRPPVPRASAERFAAKVALRDARALHGMLTREGKAALSEEAVRRLLQEGEAELVSVARAVTSDERLCQEVTVSVRFPGGSLELSRDPSLDGYRVTRAFATPPTAATPEAALVELREALLALDLERLLRILSVDQRKAMSARLERVAEALERSDAIVVEPTAAGYVVTLGDGLRILLVREVDGYRILEVR